MDDVTPERLIDLMDRQDGCMTVCSAEGGLFDSLSGRYDKTANFDIYLKATPGTRLWLTVLDGKPTAYQTPA